LCGSRRLNRSFALGVVQSRERVRRVAQAVKVWLEGMNGVSAMHGRLVVVAGALHMVWIVRA